MTGWKDVLSTVGSALGSTAGDCVLEFLKVLPEEVTEGRKINLTVRSTDIHQSSFQHSDPATVCGITPRRLNLIRMTIRKRNSQTGRRSY